MRPHTARCAKGWLCSDQAPSTARSRAAHCSVMKASNSALRWATAASGCRDARCLVLLAWQHLCSRPVRPLTAPHRSAVVSTVTGSSLLGMFGCPKSSS